VPQPTVPSCVHTPPSAHALFYSNRNFYVVCKIPLER